jgi:hypothetical protein
MQVRADQIQAYEADSEPRFTAQIINHLSIHQPETISGIPPEELITKVELFKARARSYGLTWQSSITGFVAICFAVGPNFDRQPRIHSVLTDASIEPDQRVEQLRHRVSDRDWGEAAMVS